MSSSSSSFISSRAVAPSIAALLEEQANSRPRSPAILAPGRAALTYEALFAQLTATRDALNGFGLGRSDRIAVVFPNGPEMATAFLGIAASATCAPLNPTYRADEYEFYLSDLRAKALIIPTGDDSAARHVARRLGIRVLELTTSLEKQAGLFALDGPDMNGGGEATFAHPDDVALVLHTSGTTSRPKLVPLTQGNLCRSAANIAKTLELSESDRCLNVMPLFHIHGLVAALLSSLRVGASILCTPGFYAPEFCGWLEQSRATWYTAVPTMHQAILARLASHSEERRPHSLRFIRSSSAALPPSVMTELEAVFGAPVVEAYGMTEASHQMASNPLPPRARKPGSVGLAAGPEVAVMDENGGLLGPGEHGEIVIRGSNVTPGYEGNPEANAKAFDHSWFRTGDQGYLDEDGYLFLTGRLKEIINCGGEKISPREIDEALMGHPAVAQAVAFAVPDPRLGEAVGAAVVLKTGALATAAELRHFVAAHLADFKVPYHLKIVIEIPKGPTGKIQRIGLAGKLGLPAAAAPSSAGRIEYVAPRTPLEEQLAQIWADVLRTNVRVVGVHTPFLDLGGDSMLATQVVSRVRQSLRREITVLMLFESPTVAKLADALEKSSRSGGDADRLLTEISKLSDEEAERLLEQEMKTESQDPS